MAIVLAATHHDAEGRQEAQIRRMATILRTCYAGMALVLTPQTVASTTQLLRSSGALVHIAAADAPTGHVHLGFWRRAAVATALEYFPSAPTIHFCDFDRLLHWAEYHPDELAATLARLTEADFTVLGRPPRAFATHPCVQRDTEALINHTFALVSGLEWDVTAASRGLSAQAARTLVAESTDDTIGSDCSWPLLLQRRGDLRLGYLATEGLEFETLDRYADEVAALGGPQAWCDRLDADPRQWLYRVELAQAEIASVLQFYAP
jgi:hypothetical protein